MAEEDILQGPSNLKEEIEKAKYLIDDLASRLDELGDKGDEGVADIWNALMELEADIFAAQQQVGEQAVPAVDTDEDEVLDCELADSELVGTPLSYTLALNSSSEYEWYLYNGLATSFTLEKGEDPAFTKKSWTAGFGIPILNKSASIPDAVPVLQWTGVDSEFSTAQKSIEWCPDGQGADDEYLLQIHNMDNAPGVTYDEPGNTFSPVGYADFDFCIRDVEGGAVDWVSLTEFMEYVSDGNIDHDNTGGVDTSTGHDGQYWSLDGTFDGSVENHACYGTSVGRKSSLGTLAIHLDNSQLYESTGADWTLDWNARDLKGADWAVLNGTIFKVEDTTAASTGPNAGAMIVTGGVNVLDNLIVQDTTIAGASAGALKLTAGGLYAANGIYATGGTNGAGEFTNGSDITVTVAGGTYGVEVTQTGGSNGGFNSVGGSYYHEGNQGLSTNGHSGGIFTDAAGFTSSIEEIATDIVEMYL